MGHFNENNARGLWLQLDLDRSALIPTAIKHGFTIHHAKSEYVLLSKWLPKDEPNKLPHFASHFIGAGGAVINEETNEILVIQEKISLVGNLWKIPGGLVDEGETIAEAAVREVWEETGIKAKFHSIIAFREKLNYKWDQPDLYFVVLLKPETFDIKIDPSEIGDAKWMKIEEYCQTSMIETQKKISAVIGFLAEKDKDMIKSLASDNALDMAGFGGEKFNLKLEHGSAQENMFYCANVIKEWNKKRNAEK